MADVSGGEASIASPSTAAATFDVQVPGWGASLATEVLGVAPSIASVTMVDSDTLRITFSTDVTLTGESENASNWVLTPDNQYDAAASVLGMSVNGATVDLVVTEHTNGQGYSLSIPAGIADSVAGNLFIGPFAETYTAVGIPPAILQTRTVDARTIEIIFSEAVNEGDALYQGNYSIDNGLTVLSVAKVSPFIYRLSTSKQTIGVTYTVTVTGVRDLSGTTT